MQKKLFTTLLFFTFALTGVQAKKWSLDECLQYAMQNNTTLLKAGLTNRTNAETYNESKSQLFPSLSFSTSHNGTITPWKLGGYSVAGGNVEASMKQTYTGSYGLNAKWTVWNGNQNRNTIRQNNITTQQSQQDSIKESRKLEEDIVTLYIQILYSKEAVTVNKQTLEFAKVNEKRGLQMVKVGSMSKAECSQLTATRAEDEYNVIQAESYVNDYKRQLKALLQIINDDEEFDIADGKGTDLMALEPIPSLQSVYEQAKLSRPEIKKAQLQVQSAEIQQKLAKAKRLPTVSLDASAASNTNTMNSNRWEQQMKYNFNIGGGVTVSVPIFDQRATKTAVNKANIQKQTALLEIQNQETTLHSTIEKYWIDAVNNQNQFKAAKVSTSSAKESYELLSEQFALGLKNITELQEGKSKLLTAEQNELQSKYKTILDLRMLEFYKK